MILSLVSGIALSIFAVNVAADWGTIMCPKVNIVIRAQRSVSSKIKGRLIADQPVKVAFLKKSWYAVFKVAEKEQREATALGYVPAALLYKPVPKSSAMKPVDEIPSDMTDKPLTLGMPSVDIKNVSFKMTEDGKEVLFITFNRFYMPAITTIQGEAPRILLSVPDTSSLKKDPAVITVKGTLVRDIRSELDPKTRVTRIELRMEPYKDYFINPVFYEKENLYSLEIAEEKKR
jgi:hypothetical protein